MKKISSLCLSCFFLLSLATPSGYSQSGEEILEKLIEALGGRKVLESIKDTTISASMEMIQMGFSGTATLYQKAPNKIRMDFEVMGMTFTQAYDGETAWIFNPQTGSAEEMQEKLAEEMKRDALGNEAFLYPEKYGITYSYKGKKPIEGKEYFVIEQTYSDGHKIIHYVDQENYLTVKSVTTSLNPMGVEVEAEIFASDYKRVKGMMVAHSMTIFHDSQEYIKMTIIQVRFNTGLEDSLFEMSE